MGQGWTNRAKPALVSEADLNAMNAIENSLTRLG